VLKLRKNRSDDYLTPISLDVQSQSARLGSVKWKRPGATNLQAFDILIDVPEAVLNHIIGTRAGVEASTAGTSRNPKKWPHSKAVEGIVALLEEKFVADGCSADNLDKMYCKMRYIMLLA
jgi:hypothetical protein